MNSQAGISASRKVDKDNTGYILAKPTQQTSILRDVIVSQKEKMENQVKITDQQKDELRMREIHIKQLQSDIQLLMDEKKQLKDNLKAFQTQSKTSLKVADDPTKIQILEEQLEQRAEFEQELIKKL